MKLAEGDETYTDAQGLECLKIKAEPKPPEGLLRIRLSPYPHLSDGRGAVIARDYIDEGVLAWILDKVNGKGIR